MPTPLFSTYRQGENRVTSTFLAVLERLSLPNIDRILQALLQDDFNLVTFENQPKGNRSTPDAKIQTGRAIWIETKTARNAVRHNQISNHLRSLGRDEKLLLLTPDDIEPQGLDSRVVWSNFKTLDDAIRDILADEEASPSEMETTLLREFILMLKQDDLLASTEPRVLVVAARNAWDMYQQLSLYRCSPDKPMRPFREGDSLAFYKSNEIKPLVPRIRAVIESIKVAEPSHVESLDSSQQELIEEMRDKIDAYQQWHQFPYTYKVMFLSKPDHEETIKLTNPIQNDQTDKNGRRVAFTFGARYVTLDSLKKASTTSELEPCEL